MCLQILYFIYIREQLSGRYGIAVLRDSPFHRPFKAPYICSQDRKGRPSKHNIGNHMPGEGCDTYNGEFWVQHTAGEEAGGSGGGGSCTDTSTPADWMDDLWLYKV
jgi:hypothetical protein